MACLAAMPLAPPAALAQSAADIPASAAHQCRSKHPPKRRSTFPHFRALATSRPQAWSRVCLLVFRVFRVVPVGQWAHWCARVPGSAPRGCAVGRRLSRSECRQRDAASGSVGLRSTPRRHATLRVKGSLRRATRRWPRSRRSAPSPTAEEHDQALPGHVSCARRQDCLRSGWSWRSLAGRLTCQRKTRPRIAGTVVRAEGNPGGGRGRRDAGSGLPAREGARSTLPRRRCGSPRHRRLRPALAVFIRS